MPSSTRNEADYLDCFEENDELKRRVKELELGLRTTRDLETSKRGLKRRIEDLEAKIDHLHKIFRWLVEDDRVNLSTVNEMVQADVDALVARQIEHVEAYERCATICCEYAFEFLNSDGSVEDGRAYGVAKELEGRCRVAGRAK